MKEILNVKHLKKNYGIGTNITTVIHDINFSVVEGEFISIMGASGSGKTTLLNCISTIDVATEGDLVIGGTELGQLGDKEMAKFRREKLGFIFQDFNLLETLTVEENISLALTINHVPVHTIKEKVRKVAEQFHIEHILRKYPYEISGGEKQRCACGRAIINQPQLVLADEPTGALDSVNSKTLMESLQFMNENMGTTVLVVTHDIVVSSYTKRILILKDGRIYEELKLEGMSQEEKLKKLINIESVVGR